MTKSQEIDIKEFNKELQVKSQEKEHFIESISKTSILLEHEVDTILSSLGFITIERAYVDKTKDDEEKLRQLDIYAGKSYNQIILDNGFILTPQLTLIGDCKSTEDINNVLLITELTKKSLSKTLLRIPFFVNGEGLDRNLLFGCQFQSDHFFKLFGSLPITNKVVNFNLQKKKVNNENEEERTSYFNICETQIIPALHFFYLSLIQFIDGEYSALSREYSVLRKTINDAIASNVDLKTALAGKQLPLHLIVPIVVTNKKIVKLQINEKTSMFEGIQEEKFVLYLVTPSQPRKFRCLFHDATYNIPILIVNKKYLREVVQFLEQGINNFYQEIKDSLNKDIKLIRKEVNSYFEKIDII